MNCTEIIITPKHVRLVLNLYPGGVAALAESLGIKEISLFRRTNATVNLRAGEAGIIAGAFLAAGLKSAETRAMCFGIRPWVAKDVQSLFDRLRESQS